MIKFKVKSSYGDLMNHEYFCILHALVDQRSFRRICPGGLVKKSESNQTSSLPWMLFEAG